MSRFQIIRHLSYTATLIATLGCGNGSGGGTISDVKSWDVAQRISAVSGDTGAPEVAIDTGGNAFAIFRDFVGAYASRFVVGGGWDTAQSISRLPSSSSIESISIATAPNGEVVAVWSQLPTVFANPDAWINRLIQGGNWGVPQRLETVAAPSYGTQLALDAQGTGTIVWVQAATSGSDDNLMYRNYAPGGFLSGNFVIDQQSTRISGTPSISVDGNGRGYVAWSQGVGSGVSLFAAWSAGPSSLNWTQELVDVLSPEALRPRITANASGTAFLVWDQAELTGNPTKIWARRRPDSNALGAWETPLRLDSDSGGNATNARVAVDANGNAIAIWQQSDGVRNNIWSNRFSAGSWGTPELRESNDGNAISPRLAMRPGGEAIAIWTQEVNGNARVWVSHFEPIAGWDTPLRLENDVAKNALSPTVSFDSDGNAFALWGLSDPAASGISKVWASRYH